MPKRRANGEGSIFKRKDGLWAAQYTDNTGKTRTLYGKTQQIAKEKLKEAIKQSESGLLMDKGKITFAEWLIEWLEVYAKPTCRKGTYANYYHKIYKHVIPAFPKVLIRDLRHDMLQKFFNEKAIGGRIDGKEGGLSAHVLRNLKMIITSALNQAEENGIINTNAAKKIKLPIKAKSEISILTKDEQKRLEEAVMNDNNHLSFAILLDLYTGLRIGELLALKISDIDFDNKELYVRSSRRPVQVPGEGRTEMVEGEPKTQSGKRIVPLKNEVVELLKKHIEDRAIIIEAMHSKWESSSNEQWKDLGYLLIVQRNGNPPDHRTIRCILNRLLESTGIKHINIHALRHTFATRCLENGFDIRTLADILGHSDVAMTLNVYSHSMPDQKRSNIDKLTMLNKIDEKKTSIK